MAGSGTAYRRAPLTSLRVFVAVAEHRSFTRGADALGLTTSAASMQIQSLEDYLRVPLFRRSGRHVELTPAAEILWPKVEHALADLERAIDEARADRGSGPLRITTLAFFLAQWLLPRLPSFSARYPGIDVQIQTAVELSDFVKNGMDLGIRYGAGTWPRVHTQRLFDEWLVPVCTAQLLERHGAICEAGDLKRYKLLHSPYEPWSAWLLEGATTMRGRARALYLMMPSPSCVPLRQGKAWHSHVGHWWRMRFCESGLSSPVAQSSLREPGISCARQHTLRWTRWLCFATG